MCFSFLETSSFVEALFETLQSKSYLQSSGESLQSKPEVGFCHFCFLNAIKIKLAWCSELWKQAVKINQ